MASRQEMTKAWIIAHKPLFGAFLETHIQLINSGRMESAIPRGWKWHGNFIAGRSARIVVVWDPRVSVMVYKETAQVTTCGVSIPSLRVKYTVSFVYGFNLVEQRLDLWNDLVWLSANTPLRSHPWSVLGDFNQILRVSQHSSHHREAIDVSGIEDFNQALQEANLFESPSKGLPFSWLNNQQGNPISKRIDHILINEVWFRLFPAAYSELLEPMQSDHSPILVTMPGLCPLSIKPFKFFNHIVDHPSFAEEVEMAWAAVSIIGSSQYKLFRSLKGLKPVLRSLNKRFFSDISRRVREQAEIVKGLQRALLASPTQDLVRDEHLAREKWWVLIKAEEKFLKQKSRVKWLNLGDRNTSFFHKTVAQRLVSNHIYFLKDHDGRKIESASELKEHAASYFKSILGSTNMPLSPCDPQFLADLLPFRCSVAQAAFIQRPVLDDEIIKTVFAMPLDKCPGPDGYSVEFFRASWSKVGPDVLAAVKEFFRNGRLLKDLNTTYLALIPKTAEACELNAFRPISCCNLVYKIIAKILANRLKPLLSDCISPNQSAFLKGRSLGENVLLALELIKDYDKSDNPRAAMLKVDIRKAFDSVCWDFVDKLLTAQEFPPIFRNWVYQCISTPRFSVSINGELAGFFEGKKGLRQGDPLSPYIFIMVMEPLSRLLNGAVSRGEVRLHHKCSDPIITHLLFADDLLVFTDGTRHSLHGVLEVLSNFKDVSGLDMNHSKSDMFLSGYTTAEKAEISTEIGVRLGSFPCRYLGLPLHTKKLSMAALQPFLDRIMAKLQTWRAKFLSFAGKVTLITSVIYGMVNVWTKVFQLPKEFFTKVDALCSSFLWKHGQTGGRAKVKWDEVCKPKAEGGLGIRKLDDYSTVFGSLWVAWVKANIFSTRSFWDSQESRSFSWTIRNMLRLRSVLSGFLRCDVKNGNDASFWYDTWTIFGPLIRFIGETGPSLLRIRLDAKVSEATSRGSWMLPHARTDRVQELLIYLTTVQPPTSDQPNDQFSWKKGDGVYSTKFSSKATWNILRNIGPLVPWRKVLWFKQGIPGASFCLWLVILNRLQTRDRLVRWGMQVPTNCVLCLSGMENHSHLFFECSYSASVWSPFANRLCDLRVNTFNDIIDYLQHRQDGDAIHLATIMKLLLQVTVYAVWKERNARIFRNTTSSASDLRAIIDRQMRNRLISFPAATISTSATLYSVTSLLGLYFGCINYPF